MDVRFTASSMVALLAVSLGYGIVLPLAPELAARCDVGKGGAAFHTGAMSAAYLFAFAGLAPVWGLVADRARPPLVAVAGLVVFAGAFALVSASRELVPAYVLLVVAGVAASAVFPSLQVGAHSLADETARLRLLAAFGGASFVGWFLGPPLATWISSSPDDKISLPALTVAALGALSAVMMVATQAALLAWPRLRPSWATTRVAGLLGMMAVTNLAMTYLAGAWLVFAATAVMATAATVLQVMVTAQVLAAGGANAGWALGLQIAIVAGGQAAGSLLAGILFSVTGRSFYAGATVLTVVIAWVCVSRRR